MHPNFHYEVDEFGRYRKRDYFSFMKRVVLYAPKKAMSSTSIDLYLRQCYDIEYGIYLHQEADDQTFSIIGAHDHENIYNEFLPLQRRVKSYVEDNIKDIFGYSFTEWIGLTRSEQYSLLEGLALVKKPKELESLEEK